MPPNTRVTTSKMEGRNKKGGRETRTDNVVDLGDDGKQAGEGAKGHQADHRKRELAGALLPKRLDNLNAIRRTSHGRVM